MKDEPICSGPTTDARDCPKCWPEMMARAQMVSLDAVIQVIESTPFPRVESSPEMADGFALALTKVVQRVRDQFAPPPRET